MPIRHLRKKADPLHTIRAVDCIIDDLGPLVQLVAYDLEEMTFLPGAGRRGFSLQLVLSNGEGDLEIIRGQVLIRDALDVLRVIEDPAALVDFEPYDPDEA